MNEQNQAKSGKKWYQKWWVIALLLMFFYGLGKMALELPKTSTEASQSATEAPQKVAYEVTKEWAIPNGGKGMVIVLSPDKVNLSDMERLGEQLREAAKSDRVGNVVIFSDKATAQQYDNSLNLIEEEKVNYLKHLVGVYNKNVNTGSHEFSIYLDGIDGAVTKKIQYE